MESILKISLSVILFIISSVAGLYFSIKNPITHTNFYVVVEGDNTSLISTSPQGDNTNIKAETNEENDTTFFWGASQNQLRNISYFSIKTDISKLKKISIYKEKEIFLASYNKVEFLDKWAKTDKGYTVPTDIFINRSILPKIKNIINWRGDIYIIPIILFVYLIVAVIAIFSQNLCKKNGDFIITVTALKSYVIKNKYDLAKEFSFSYMLITIAYMGLIITNYKFADDLYRMPNYNNGWLQDGRYLMHIIYQIFTINLNRGIAVATPYTYFLSIAFLSLSALILARYFNRKNIYVSLIITSLVALLPFYYANLLYQHDCLTMALSLCWAVVIALLGTHLKNKANLNFSFLGLSALFLLYQPMLTYYVFMVFFLFCFALIKNKNNLKAAFTATTMTLIGFGLAIFMYKISNSFLAGMDKTIYANMATNISNNPLARLLDLINLLYIHWHTNFLGYAIVVTLVIFIVTFIKHFTQTKPSILAIVLFALAMIGILFSPILIYLLTTINSYRFISGINLLIAMALLYIYNYSYHKYLYKVSIVISMLLFMNSFSMLSYLSNSVKSTHKYQLELKTSLKEDIYQYQKAGGKINNLGYTNPIAIIKPPTNFRKVDYLPVINYILSYSTYFAVPNIMGFTYLIALKEIKLREIKQLPYKELFNRRYYNIRYYPSLNQTVVNFK